MLAIDQWEFITMELFHLVDYVLSDVLVRSKTYIHDIARVTLGTDEMKYACE